MQLGIISQAQIAEANAKQARRESAAMDALVSAYGPQAALPQAWSSDVEAYQAATGQRAASMLAALKAMYGAPGKTGGAYQAPDAAVQQPAAQQAPQAPQVPVGNVDLIHGATVQQNEQPQPDAVSGPALGVQQPQVQQSEQLQQQAVAVGAARHVLSGIMQGQDPGEAFDQISPVLPMLGMTPEDAATLRSTVTKAQNPAQTVFGLISALTAQQKASATASRGVAVGSPQQVVINGKPMVGFVGQDGVFHIARTDAGEDVQPYAYEHDIQSTNRTAMAQQGSNLRAFAPRPSEDTYIVPTQGGYVTTEAPITRTTPGQFTKTQLGTAPNDIAKLGSAKDALNSFDAAAGDARRIVKSSRFATGIAGAASEMVPGTPAFNLARARDTIIGNSAIKTITEMKDTSKTGATGFGQLNENELQVIKTQYAALQKGMGPVETLEAINRISRVIHNAYDRSRRKFIMTYKTTPEDAANALSGGAPAVQPQYRYNPKTGKLE